MSHRDTLIYDKVCHALAVTPLPQCRALLTPSHPNFSTNNLSFPDPHAAALTAALLIRHAAPPSLVHRFLSIFADRVLHPALLDPHPDPASPPKRPRPSPTRSFDFSQNSLLSPKGAAVVLVAALLAPGHPTVDLHLCTAVTSIPLHPWIPLLNSRPLASHTPSALTGLCLDGCPIRQLRPDTLRVLRDLHWISLRATLIANLWRAAEMLTNLPALKALVITGSLQDDSVLHQTRTFCHSIHLHHHPFPNYHLHDHLSAASSAPHTTHPPSSSSSAQKDDQLMATHPILPTTALNSSFPVLTHPTPVTTSPYFRHFLLARPHPSLQMLDATLITPYHRLCAKQIVQARFELHDPDVPHPNSPSIPALLRNRELGLSPMLPALDLPAPPSTKSCSKKRRRILNTNSPPCTPDLLIPPAFNTPPHMLSKPCQPLLRTKFASYSDHLFSSSMSSALVYRPGAPRIEYLCQKHDRPRQFEFNPARPSELVYGTEQGYLVVLDQDTGEVKGSCKSGGGRGNRTTGDLMGYKTTLDNLSRIDDHRDAHGHRIPSAPVYGLSWLNKRSDCFISGSNDGSIHLYNVNWMRDGERGGCMYACETFDNLTSIHVSADDAKFAVSGCSLHVGLFDLATGKQTELLRNCHTQSINVIKFAHTNPNILVTSSFDQCVKKWDLRQSGLRRPVFQTRSKTDNVMACFSPDDSRLLVSAVDNEVRQYLACDGRLEMEFEIPKTGSPYNFTRSYYMNNRDYIISGSCMEHVVRVFNARTGAFLEEVEMDNRDMVHGSRLCVQSLRANPGKRFNFSALLVSSNDSTYEVIANADLHAR